MKKLPIMLAVSALATGAGFSAVILPTYLSADSSPDALSSPSKLVDDSGMTPNVLNGDDLSLALSAEHDYNGGYQESWVTNANGADYFSGGTSPIIVFDLGADTTVGSVLIWQYQNNGGGDTNVGNQAYTINVRFNTAAEGSSTFSGAPTLITLKKVPGADGLNGVNSAQAFAVPTTPTARYVQFEVTDNYRGISGVTGGGDRVGLGEVRFATDVVPEPSSALLGTLGLLALLRRRR